MSKIVVVDDSKLMRNLIKHLLEQAGHQVEVWEDLKAEEIPQRIASSDPELIITDYQMPGCNGLTVATQARTAKPELPILVVTSSHDPAVLEPLQKLEACRILHKPLREEVLLEAVKLALGS